MIPKKLLDEIKLWITESRYGSIQINFSAGKIVNMNINHSVKVESIGMTIGLVKVSANQDLKVDE